MELVAQMRTLMDLIRRIVDMIAFCGPIPAKTLFEMLNAQAVNKESFDRLMLMVCATGRVVRDGLVFRQATVAEMEAHALTMLEEIKTLIEEAGKRGE